MSKRPTAPERERLLDVDRAAATLRVPRGEVIEMIRTHRLFARHEPGLAKRSTLCVRRICNHWSIPLQAVLGFIDRRERERADAQVLPEEDAVVPGAPRRSKLVPDRLLGYRTTAWPRW